MKHIKIITLASLLAIHFQAAAEIPVCFAVIQPARVFPMKN